MSDTKIYDVIVVGGGAIGLSAAYECAKAGKTVLVLEKSTFYNQSGSSGDLVRMFRTMYTEPFMADLARDAMGLWDQLESDAGQALRLMSGLLDFGDPNYGAGGPEGTLQGPIPNLKHLNMQYTELNKEEIEKKYPFKNLPDDYIGLHAPDDGVINVPLTLRTLYRLAESFGAVLKQNIAVDKIEPTSIRDSLHTWSVHGFSGEKRVNHLGKKLIITCGAYTNHILAPSFNCHLALDIWEMVASYWAVNAGPVRPFFQACGCNSRKTKTKCPNYSTASPPFLWGPENLVRIAVDAATNQITDPEQRQSTVVSPEDIKNVQEFVKERITGVVGDVPAYSLGCLQTNVLDNMFVLDFLPIEEGGLKDSVAIFTAGWAMKFIPLLGKALKEMVIDGHSPYILDEFSITRVNPATVSSILSAGPGPAHDVRAKGSRSVKNKGSFFYAQIENE